MKFIKPYKFNGVFTDGRNLFTENLVPGKTVYDERLTRVKGAEYRQWNPYRSKLASFIQKGGINLPLHRKSAVLYLGAASGTTVSHVSDIAPQGIVYAVEVSIIPFQKLLFLSRQRKNLIPILADAGHTEKYAPIVPQVDFLYQDIAQRDQLFLFRKNMQFLRPGGYGMMMVKARSIDVALEPRDIFNKIAKELDSGETKVVEKKELQPYEKDHAAIVVRKV